MLDQKHNRVNRFENVGHGGLELPIWTVDENVKQNGQHSDAGHFSVTAASVTLICG